MLFVLRDDQFLERDVRKKHALVDQLEEQVLAVPVLKRRQCELEEKLGLADKSLLDKDMNISRIMESHQNEKEGLSLDFERQKKEILSESSKTMMEKEQKYLEQLRQQMSLLEQESEHVKQSLLEDLSKLRCELAAKDQQIVEMDESKRIELEKLKLQITTARRTAAQNKPGSAEIFRKKMQQMEHHYVEWSIITWDYVRTMGTTLER